MHYAPTLKKFPAPLLKKCNLCGFRNSFENSPDQICFICGERMGQSENEGDDEAAGGGSPHASASEKGSPKFQVGSFGRWPRGKHYTNKSFSCHRGNFSRYSGGWERTIRKKYKHYLKGGLDCPKQ